MNEIQILSRYVAKLNNTKPLMKMISQDMLAIVRENFDKEGRPKWTPLAKSTIRQRRKKGHWPGKILQRSGQLLRSIIPSSDNNSAVVSTNKAYAAIHQYGGTIPIAARTKTIFHRTDAKGNFLKQKGNDKLLVFAKSSHKRKSAFTFGQRRYNINIPARPFLHIPDNDLEQIKQKIQIWIMT